MSGFEEMGLRPEILKAIQELGYEQPTPIQQAMIPELLGTSNDFVGLAQTGTGKTAAFGLPMVQQFNPENRSIQALVLSPTRELAIQIGKDLEGYAKYLPKFKVGLVYGGANIVQQIKQLEKGVNVVVGTPGRVLDLLKRKALNISAIKTLVLDEADEMLNMGFKDDLDAILSKSPREKQTLLFSATMPAEIRRISGDYMHNPKEIAVGKKNAGAENVNHQYYMVHARDRFKALKRIADMHPKIYGLVFCRTRAETKDIADKLMREGYNADALHGDLSQSQREYVMKRFRLGNIQLLVATDVAARGLDVDNLTHVIHYNLPDEPEIYIHRSGRTGRAGKKGTSIALIHTREGRKLNQIEKILGKKFEQKQVPGGREICEKQLFNLVDNMEHVIVDEEQIESFLPVIYKKLEWLNREELIKRFVSVEFNRFIDYYKDAPDLNPSQRKPDMDFDGGGKKFQRKRDSGGPEKGYTRFFLSMGRNRNLSPPQVIGMINDITGRKDIPIGRIDIGQKFSFFEIGENFKELVISSFKHAHGVRVSVALPDNELADTGKRDRKGGKKKKKFKKK